MLVLITGGARSGKSAHAVAVAQSLAGPVVFLATALPIDEEMAERIRRHRQVPQPKTQSAPLDIMRLAMALRS